MKVGILTFTDGTNIGQRLQNYALQRTVELLISNSQVFTIKQGYPFSPLKRDIRNMVEFLRNPATGILRYKRQRKFAAFNKRYIRFYHKEMPFYGDNTAFSKDFDCFIVGSDQVWNPNSPFVGPNFFLSFAKPKQRITYAPSFSVDELPDEKIEEYKKSLDGFDSITVREDCGARIVADITDVPVEVVLDPTLLLARNEYDLIKTPYSERPQGKYILALYLGKKPQKDIDKVSEQLGFCVFYLEPDTVIGPDEFLDVIEHAELVLTDSYHVTIFSILYHRPFINFIRSGEGKKMNSRFETLYRILKVQNRTWEYLKKHDDEIMKRSYEDTDTALKHERVRCREKLKRNIEEVFSAME